MKKVVYVLFFITASLQAQSPLPQKGLDAITASSLEHHVNFMASDAMQGRNTPGPELDSCAAYISGYFKKHGISTPETSSYFQEFFVMKTRLGEPNTLVLTTHGEPATYEIKTDFVPLHFTANAKAEGNIVFAGYGITAPEYGYDDYEEVDVKDRIVLVFMHEPQENDSTSVFDGKRPTDYSKLLEKAVNARNHGAVGMLVVTDPNNHRFLRPPNTWPSLMRNAPKDAVPLTLEEKTENKVVAMQIGKNLAEAIMNGTAKTMESLQTLIDSTLKPQSFEIPGKTLSFETRLDSDRMPTNNVCGLIEGSDPVLKNEIIIIGAHYDHLGARGDSAIYHGADDNASGTAGMMILAKAFASSGEKPKRSILFCAWSGEEKGLFGSRFYTGSSPLFPLGNTVINLNLDMIGRNDSSRVDVSGLLSSDTLKAFLDTANRETGIEIIESKGISGSDHFSFYQKKIPVLGFHTGTHKDYHKPTDTADRINYKGSEQICKLVFRLAWMLSQDRIRPSFAEKGK